MTMVTMVTVWEALSVSIWFNFLVWLLLKRLSGSAWDRWLRSVPAKCEAT